MKRNWKGKGYIFLIIGALLLLGGLISKVFGVYELPIDFCMGLGCAWVIIGVIALYRKKRNPKWDKEQAIAAKDERNIQIRGRAANLTFAVTALTLTILSVVFLALDLHLASILVIAVLLVHCLSYLISCFVLGKKL